MPITVSYTYKRSNTILKFKDSELRKWGLPVWVKNSKIGFVCSDKSIERALSLKHDKNYHEIFINWGLYSMSCPEVNFVISVTYDDETRMLEEVILKYPLHKIGFKTNLSVQNGTWGVQPKCVLSIKPNINKRDAWKYEEKSVKLSFPNKSNSFFPADQEFDREFNSKEGIDVPLLFNFEKKPITSRRETNVSFELNNDAKSLPFSFEPYEPDENSYIVDMKRLERNFKYGSKITKIFKVEVKRNSDFVSQPIIKSIESDGTSPFVYNDDDGQHYICIDPSKSHWVVRDTLYSVSIILSNSLIYHKEIHLTPHDDLPESNYVQILPGDSPQIQISPNKQIEMYVGEEREKILQINNTLNAPITIRKITSSDNLYLYNRRRTIQPGEVKNFEFSVKGVENKNVTYSIETDETEVAEVTLNVKVLPLSDASLKAFYEPLDNYQLIFEPNYRKSKICGKILVSYSYTERGSLPFSKEDFLIDSENFVIDSSKRIDDGNFEYLLRIMKGAFSEDRSLPEPQKIDGKSCYPLSWKYHDKNGSVMIPFKKPMYYEISKIDIDSITFPYPGKPHRIRVCDIELSYPEKFDSNIHIIDDEQSLSINAPFCFIFNDVQSTAIEVTDPIKATIYLNLDDLEGINTDTVNIVSPIDLNIELTRKSKRKGEKTVPKAVKITPIEEKEKKRIYFVTCENKHLELAKNVPSNTEIRIFEQSDDVLALKLGVVHVANLSKIPSGMHAVRMKIKTISAAVDGTKILHEDSTSYIGKSIEVYNGDPDFEIPLTIDYQLWKQHFSNGSTSILVYIEFERDNGNLIKYGISFDVNIEYVDDVYALDLGTTGIVVAKERDGMQEIIKLQDAPDDPIEIEDEIISSHTMLIANDSNEERISQILLSPPGNEYYGITTKNRFRLVPTKFIIGQDHIPYLQDFYENAKLQKRVKLYNLDDEVDLTKTENEESNRETISTLVASLYKSIFHRFGRDTSQIKKLVITYPNTYTIENLDYIGSILRHELKLNLNGQVTFVPESDAVAAYYFDQIIMNKGGFLDENRNPKDVENVIIYDMGAGTLDLSLISFVCNNNDSITASIINKIGIPLAGNYLDYIICNTLLQSGIIKEELIKAPNAMKELSVGIKKSYDPDIKIKEQRPDWYTEYYTSLSNLSEQTYSNIFKKNIEGFLETCSKTVLELLIPQNTRIDTIVFSGRASKFSSLRDRVKNSLDELTGNNVRVDELMPTRNCGDYLKTCVAIGALKYQSFFKNNNQFKIENKNLYSKVAVVYWGRENGIYGVNVRFLLDPQSVSWSDAELINGTWCREFNAKETISNHLQGRHLYYVQTCLDENRLKELFRKIYVNDNSMKDDLNWAFVNILCKQRITDSEPFEVSLRISKDNKILERRIGTKLLLDTKLLENVEENELYRRSMWPFIVKNLND